MGGGDKCLKLLHGRTLFHHIWGRIEPQVSTILINANGDPARFAGHDGQRLLAGEPVARREHGLLAQPARAGIPGDERHGAAGVAQHRGVVQRRAREGGATAGAGLAGALLA